MEEIKEVYNAKKHPDVQNGKKTEDEVLMEFIETFEATYNYLNGDQSDGKITIDEFMEYYENASMGIDDVIFIYLFLFLIGCLLWFDDEKLLEYGRRNNL